MLTKSFKSIVILILSILQTLTYELKEEESVIIITDKNYEEVFEKYSNIIVQFYNSTCSHCVNLDSEFIEAAKILNEYNLYLGKLDASLYKEFAKRFGVSEYPTLKFFNRGLPNQYDGGIKSLEIVDWFTKKIGPICRQYSSLQDIQDSNYLSYVYVVFFGNSSSNLFKIFESVGYSFKEKIKFGYIDNEEAKNHYKIAQDSVIIFKKFDEGRADLPTGFTRVSLKAFVDINSMPTVAVFDEKYGSLIFDKSNPAIFLFPYVNNNEKTQKLYSIFTSMAKSFKHKLIFMITSIMDYNGRRVAEFLGVKENELPSIRISDTRSKLIKYKMLGEISEKNIYNFIDSWEKGILKPYYKSEDIPEFQENDVIRVVGHTFNDIVMDDTKDVLVEFYTTWCEHARNFIGNYNYLAFNLKHNKNLVIAKIDINENDIEQVRIKVSPTIKLYPARKKNIPIDYDGEKTVEELTEWIIKYSTNKLTRTPDHKDDL